MEPLGLLIAGIFIFWCFKQFSRTNNATSVVNYSDEVCFASAKKLVYLNNKMSKTEAADLLVVLELMSLTCSAIKALRIKYGHPAKPGSFAARYLTAIEYQDYAYITKVHRHLADLINESPTKEKHIHVMESFFDGATPKGFHQSTLAETISFNEYYEIYISEVKRLDASNIYDGIHWVMLADDDGTRRAYQDGVPPHKLAKLILETTKITDLKL